MRPQKRPGILIRVIPEGVASYVLVQPKRCPSHPPGADSGGYKRSKTGRCRPVSPLRDWGLLFGSLHIPGEDSASLLYFLEQERMQGYGSIPKAIFCI
jgi:hypothetical protein